MPTLLPGGLVFQSGKDGNGYLLNGAGLGHVSAPVVQATGFCPGGSFGGSIFDPVNATIYATCSGGLRALSLGTGSVPSLSPRAGFSAPTGATGPPTIAGGLLWATNHSTGTLYGLDLSSGATSSLFSIPEAGSQVNHFATPSAGGGRLFVGSGDQVTAYTVAQAPPPSSTITALAPSANPARAGTAVSLTATIAPGPDAGAVTFTDGGKPIPGCSNIAVSAATSGRASCRTAFTHAGTHHLAASYSGDAFYAASTSGVLIESVAAVPTLSGLHLSSHRVSIAGRKVGGRCVKPTRQNKRRSHCRRPVRLRVFFTLKGATTVKLTFKRRDSGRKVGGRCVKPTQRNHRHARCTRLNPVHGSITLKAKAGRNAFTFRGKVGARELGPGGYQLTATPRSGSSRTATFTIVG